MQSESKAEDNKEQQQRAVLMQKDIDLDQIHSHDIDLSESSDNLQIRQVDVVTI